jgi:hypothetical protein
MFAETLQFTWDMIGFPLLRTITNDNKRGVFRPCLEVLCQKDLTNLEVARTPEARKLLGDLLILNHGIAVHVLLRAGTIFFQKLVHVWLFPFPFPFLGVN